MGEFFGAEDVGEEVEVALREDAVEVFLVVVVEDVAQEEADEGVGPALAALSDAEDYELDQLGRLDRQHLVLEHQ